MVNRITIILRGYDMDSARKIAQEADKYSCFSLEIAANSAHAFEVIKALHEMNLQHVSIGAGTIINMDLLHQARDAGAVFALSPVCMSREMIDFCHENQMVSVPGAFSPTEIQNMKEYGADIIKLFPASELPLGYMKAIMAPLGHLHLMVVGGINAGNVADYFTAGAEYAGIGSGICNKEEVRNGDLHSVIENLRILSQAAEKAGAL